MKVTVAISSMKAGGAQRLVAILANHWAEKGWSVTLMILGDGRNSSFYDLHPSIVIQPVTIRITPTGPLDRIAMVFKRFLWIRRAIRQDPPDVVVAHMNTTNIRLILSTLGLKTPVVIVEHVDPAQSTDFKTGWRLIRWLAYPFADKLISPSQGIDSFFSKLPKRKRVVIGNPIGPLKTGLDQPNELKASPSEKKIILSMGRLVAQKGFDLLLEAFSKISAKHPDWSLVIYGEGIDRRSLEKLRDDLELTRKVQFAGLTKQPFDRMKESDLFVLSSRYEGFAIVLCEAMACGLPVISFDCPVGPAEIIREGTDGLLVPPEDIDALAAAMDRLMGNDEERKRFSTHALEVTKRFDSDKIFQAWEQVLEEVRS